MLITTELIYHLNIMSKTETYEWIIDTSENTIRTKYLTLDNNA